MSQQGDTPFTIRPASVDDYELLYSMMSEFAAFQKTPERLTLTLGQLKLDKDLFKCLLAESPTHGIIGFSTYFFAYYSWTGRALYMDDLYVQQPFRGHGVGSLLMQAIIKIARESGCNKVKWQVSRWNEAGIGYYQQLGASIDEVDINCDLKL